MVVRSRRYAWYILILLTLLNVVNYMDRMVIVTMYDDLRAQFGFSDAELGAFWSAFFIVHSLLLIPFGWASDRYNRIRIMAAGVIAWSLATLGSAYAVGFISLLVLRGLIGVGEASYGPVSNALLCEVFKPSEKARTVGIYNGGMFIGACVGMGIGTALGFPLAFQVVAIPGLVLGVMVVFLDVPKHRVEQEKIPKETLGSVFKNTWKIVQIPTLRWMLAAGTLISFTAGGYIAWAFDFVKDYKGLTGENALWSLGGITITAGLVGVLVGGFLADRLQKRWPFGRILTIAIGFIGSVPFALGTLYIDTSFAYYLSTWLFIFFIPWYNGPMAAVIDDVVDDKDANTAQAVFACLLHLLGTAPASLVVGIVSDWSDLRTALLIPTFTTVIAALCCVKAAGLVEKDMKARQERMMLSKKVSA